MKIALITDGLALGGSERQTVIAAAALGQRGHDVEILAYHPHNDFSAFIRENEIRVTVIEAGRSSRIARVAKLAGRLHDRRFDVVHAFKDTASVWGRVAARLARVPCIFGGYRTTVRLKGPFRALHTGLAVSDAGWIVNTETGREIVMRDFHAAADRVFVVHNAVHPRTYESTLTPQQAKARLGIASNVPVVSIVANLRAMKNHAMFFDMARRVSDARYRPVFLVVGSGPQRDQVTALQRASGLGDNIRLLGSQEQIADLWRATDVAVITSFHEGLCSALIEAGAAGLPCVSTDNGGGGEVLVDGETGFLVPQGDDAALAERVRALLADPLLRMNIGAAARERVTKRFSLDRMAESLLHAYRSGIASVRHSQ